MKCNKKNKFIIMVFILMLCITIGYAALNSTLNINGRSNISKNTWNIYFDNVVTTNGSVEAVKIPTIENSTTVDFEVALNLPGDFYEFTVDVVNNGTIDAMIESINKTPDLTLEQEKYLNYIIFYENGEEIATKQLVEKESFVRLKVKVELRKDIDPSDLPEVGDVLYLSFTVNYVQSDGTGISVKDNGKVKLINVVSGDGTQTSDEVCIKEECFYVMYSDENTVTMLSKYNLYVGGSFVGTDWNAYGEEATGKQDSTMLGHNSSGLPCNGTTAFSNSNSTYEGSIVEGYVNNYNNYLMTQGITPIESRLITKDELLSLGCSVSDEKCSNAPSWVYSTSYWTGSARDTEYIWRVFDTGAFTVNYYDINFVSGVRPVIVISKDYF